MRPATPGGGERDLPPLAGAQRPAPDAAGLLEERAGVRSKGGDRQAALPPHPAPLLRDAPPRTWGGSPVGAAHARARRYLHHSDLYARSEEHTSELQSRLHLVCRLLLE